VLRNIKVAQQFAARIIRITAKFLVKQYLSRYRIRNCYASAKNFSIKTVYPVCPILHEWIFVRLRRYLTKQYINQRCCSTEAPSSSLYHPPTIPPDFNPTVSVIVPNFNSASFLQKRLDSIFRQTYPNFEVILLDDGSTDESRSILEEYRQRYLNITRYAFNRESSGSKFEQWLRGFSMARGNLIWIAESDNYCSENLLAELVKYFANEAVMLAFCRNTADEEEPVEVVQNSVESLAELEREVWRSTSVMSAHNVISKAWAVTNILPSPSNAVFRHPGKRESLGKAKWKEMKVFGDWMLYLHLIRGGLVAYTPHAINYRLHASKNTDDRYRSDIYYQEYEQIAKEVVTLYRVEKDVLERQRQYLESRWDAFRPDYSEDLFHKFYNFNYIPAHSGQRKPNLMMVAFALSAGGGETFPIKLANMLKDAGYGVTFLNLHRAPTEAGVRKMLRNDIPVLELDRVEELAAVIDDMGIELIHSHHGWADLCISNLLEDKCHPPLIVTTHGWYEMASSAELALIFPLLKKRVDKFVYIADKNLSPFVSNCFDMDRFAKINNASDIVPICPIPRAELNVPESAFLICLVSRAIPEKGWQEAIEAVKIARKISKKEIHLLLIGNGPEYERLKLIIGDEYIHFMGFRANTCDYFATSDLGLLPSRFRGESCPLVLIDCFNSNRPMIASDIGEISKMMLTSNGPAGTLLELDNWNIPINDLAHKIAAYVQDKNLYVEHLHRVPIAAAKFDPTILLKNYEAIYLELCRENILQAQNDLLS
jgi:glycosyltransferase involved in cell wall biosynthesis